MTTDTQQKLYVHDPASLLPHLRAHIPHSINVIGALLASGSPPVYATFPPKEEPPNQWVAVVAIPCGQLYLFHTALATGIEADREAEADVVASVQEAQRLHPTHHRVGGLPIQWAAAVRGVVGGEDRGVTGIYVAGDAAMRTCDAVSREEDVRALEGMGLVMDAGMPGDEDILAATNGLYTREYYATRRTGGYLTTLRPRGSSSSSEPIAWLLTHENGSLGTLYTSPAFRRRGLARLLVRQRMRQHLATNEHPPYAYVAAGNVASEKLWEGLGYECAWEVTWAVPDWWPVEAPRYPKT